MTDIVAPTTATPQPGDGAYLTSRTPQPGDGAYLAQTSRGDDPSRRGRSSRGRGRGRGRPNGGPRGDRDNSASAETNGVPNGNSRSNGGPSRQVDGNADAPSAHLATLTIEDVTSSRGRGGGQRRGRRLQMPGGYADRFVPEGDDGGDNKKPNRAKAKTQRRQQRAQQGHEANVAEARAMGVGVIEMDSPHPPDSGTTTPTTNGVSTLNPEATAFSAAFAPTTSAGPSRSHSSAGGTPPASEAGPRKGKQRNGKGRATDTAAPVAPKAMSSRRAAFERGSKLTTSDSKPARAPKREYDHQPRGNEPDDLNSRLTRGLRLRPYLECPICFNHIAPADQTWSCVPPGSQPDLPSTLDDAERATATSAHYAACYTPFHIKCIRDWASRSLKEDEERIRVNESTDEPSWRCPGCQKRRTARVGGYRCFCARVSNPPLSHTAPHSCNDACGRTRANCDHACPLNCHPGPCPPCQVALVVRCPSHSTPLTVKCAAASVNDAALRPVCDEPCLGKKSCGKHDCDQLCHFGPCPPCDEVETVRCYCGADEKVVPCGWEQDAKKICATADDNWIGRFACDRVCHQKYECGIHECQDKCHPHPVSPVPCPTSPSVITTCPCGATPLKNLPGYPRKDCLATIPTCGSPCPKSRPCGHPCPLKCHNGECPPCHEQVYRPCRCGESTLRLDCDAVRERFEEGEGEFLCERVCHALRNCGRHECGRVCCPLSYKAKRKGKRGLDFDADNDNLHVCPLTCGKLLSCGLHTCPRPDHKGACGRCLQASYDELICNCGNTVVYPPVACGATVTCVFPCARPDPPCGHPKTPHNCHEAPECPPCPFLTSKPCACGKDPAVKNIRCSASQDKVSCGQVCGKLLGCGYHKCEKTCHGGPCEACGQTCNKPKRICGHACTAVCHAPAKCPESEGCATTITQSCSCGNIQLRTTCGASVTSPTSRATVQLKCNSECAQRQRNARLADALGIKNPVDRTQTEWDPAMRAFAKQNAPFVKTVEQTFREFFNSSRQTLILPHMPPAKRTFVMSLADMYHLGRELIDAEPNRSVQIRRRVDTRIPTPLLSAVAGTVQPRPPLGALGNLRAAPGNAWGSPRASAVVAATPPTSGPTSRTASPLPGSRDAAHPTAASVAAGTSASAPTSAAASTSASPAVPQLSQLPTSALPPSPRHSRMLSVPVPAQPVVIDGEPDDSWDQSGDEA